MSASKRTEFIGSDGRDEEARIVKRSALVSFNRVTRAFICAWLSVCLAVTTWACEWRKSRRVEDRCSIKKKWQMYMYGVIRGGVVAAAGRITVSVKSSPAFFTEAIRVCTSVQYSRRKS